MTRAAVDNAAVFKKNIPEGNDLRCG